MPMTNNDIEKRIVDEARRLFIEKGYGDTSMSEIAAAAGINRPALHYYFRTKEKMFAAVFGDIVLSILPRIECILTQDRPIGERIGDVVDEYMSKFREYPFLPTFILNESNRDIANFASVVKELGVPKYFSGVRESLQKEMQEGRLRQIPIYDVIFTFYGLLLMPVLARNIVKSVFATDDCSYQDILSQWKPHIISQMEHLLLP